MTAAMKKSGKPATAAPPAPKPAPVPAAPYQPSPNEQTALASFAERREARKPRPDVRLTADAKTKLVNIDFDHADKATAQQLLMEALGTADTGFFIGLVNQLANVALTNQGADGRGLNQLLAAVVGIGPRDHVEAMLAAQMAAINALTMTLAYRLNQTETIQQQDSAASAFNKCARTFAAQVEALKRYRSSGEQKMTVEHVTVQSGGQAIVGPVNRGGNGES